MYINVLIGCADPSRWNGLNAALQREVLNELQIASQTSHLADVLWKVGESRPDVLLIEYAGGAAGTLYLLSAVRQASSTIRTLVLHDGITDEQIRQLITNGASGALMSSSQPALVCKAVRAVYQGERWFSRIALTQAIRHLVGGGAVAALVGDDELTQRESEILRYIGLGLTNKEIARRLDISDSTVKTHLHRIYVKLKLSGRYKAFLARPAYQSSPQPILVRSSPQLGESLHKLANLARVAPAQAGVAKET